MTRPSQAPIGSRWLPLTTSAPCLFSPLRARWSQRALGHVLGPRQGRMQLNGSKQNVQY